LIYDNDSYFNQLSLYEEKTILPLKEFIIRKYFDEKAKIRTESEEAHQSKTSLGFKYPEHAVVEVSDKTKSLGFKNPEPHPLPGDRKRHGCKIATLPTM